jgi:hypothetical protein
MISKPGVSQMHGNARTRLADKANDVGKAHKIKK